jgi:exosortase K
MVAKYLRDYGFLLNRLPAVALVVWTMLLLKLHYSFATAEGLRWMLGPTSLLTGWFTAANPVWESGIGYADFARGIIIAPSCAGVNFMIMAFGAAALCGLYHLKTPAGHVTWIVSSLAAAYFLALLINTLRIGISMELYAADLEFGWLDAARIHRIMGATLYFGALWIFIRGPWRVARVFGSNPGKKEDEVFSLWGPWMILGWYLLGAIGVPLINRGWRNGTSVFLEHSLMVGITALAVFVAVSMAKGIGKRKAWMALLRKKIAFGERNSKIP